MSRVSRNDCSIWEYSLNAFSVAVSCKATANQVTPEHGTSSSAVCILLQWQKAISSQAKKPLKQLTFDFVYVFGLKIPHLRTKLIFFFFFLKAIFHKSLKIILSRVQKLSQIFVVWTRGISRSSSGFEGIATFTATGKASTGTAGTDGVKFFQWISWQGFNSLWAHHPWQRDVSLLILQLSTPGTEYYSIYIQK